MEKIIVEPIKVDIPLRQLIFEHFPSLRGELPIKGGWGYTKEDAIIIDKNDPVVTNEHPFDGVGLEYIIAEKRIYEELIIFRKEEDSFSGIKWELVSQDLLNYDDKDFDKLIFKVTAHRFNDFISLKKIWERNFSNPDFDRESHMKRHIELMCWYEAEYWFEITSFLGKYD